ncbi:MAG TPA: hypothetical protein VK988_21260 [Acidimicrobiales bacterium]|nr:hypothetical protein [Acidimicrobiales bacterium]
MSIRRSGSPLVAEAQLSYCVVSYRCSPDRDHQPATRLVTHAGALVGDLSIAVVEAQQVSL